MQFLVFNEIDVEPIALTYPHNLQFDYHGEWYESGFVILCSIAKYSEGHKSRCTDIVKSDPFIKT